MGLWGSMCVITCKLTLDIAKARVRSKLIERLPNTNFTISAKDEKSILNRELNKKRRIMPLRRLFGSIPNLLMAIKPCMMMSPLSVSQFLQAETYDFDMIIFDEASQVKTEDAVGAIMRGESVIICGDTHQLPPTNFFGSSIHGDEYDNDDEELDVYDSILDEANHVLPDRRLKWHYRSKHEHLIAFSNALIYKHNLVTFPSAIEEAPNEGVEYIYVENGVYDRGGKRNNINEARKVVIMVIEHFKHYPTRSLGVVTFSRAQKDIIDDELQNYRLKDNSFEEYFSEDKKEAFFVKSLEMVQGDERDTIIFSIGYAKDRTGKPMSMNFGPLTQTGGERRLNVAITRAKHNVKLVGSIHPTDIDLDRTKSEGVKLLREYINFAINGPKVLESKTTNENDGMFDSPFEESVYDFLAMKNYKVASQIGCSGYRIDLAVKHPEHSGVYVLGIECDGATYHSTRTVRERDRIRQTVLEDMGWKIYRIWSTDYIKDPKNEQRKLVDYIDKCIREFTVEPINKTKPVEIINKPNVIDHLIVSKVQPAGSSDANVKNYGFGHYKVAQLQKEQYRYAGHINFANAVTDIIDIESPIHFDLLCKRIAPLADYEKATKRVRKVVADSIDKSIDQIDQRHDFLWKKDEKTANVRIPSEDSVIRKIEYIAPEEISVAMSTIISSSYGITEEGLYTETRRIFGFNRSGAKIVKAFDEAYQRMSDEGKIKIIDDKISLV
jgi:very-short-patch-repair endonuclease